ncbi:MAG: PQQ-binding-like beta-propeller repeat protein [candidate division WOR-3 bacterium]
MKHSAGITSRLAAFTFICLFFLLGCPKPPLVPETPRGPTVGFKDVTLACTTSTTDPGGSEVSFQFDWGDNTRTEWSDWVAGGFAYVDTHTYTQTGEMKVRARAKNRKGRVSGWSQELTITISPGEGGVFWKFGYPDPEDPEDSADFTAHTFGIGPEGQIYIGSGEIPALLCRKANGARRWEFIDVDEDEFAIAPTIGEDGTIYVGTEGGRFYALNPSGTIKWQKTFSAGIITPAALGGGTIFLQTEDDSVFAIDAVTGERKWGFYAGGGIQAPVIGPDGTVFVSQEDTLFALDPGSGGVKWRYGMKGTVTVSPAIDVTRGALYVVDEDGWFVSLNLTDGSLNWETNVGSTPSFPVIGGDGTIYLTVVSALLALDPQNGGVKWDFIPPLQSEDLSMPAVSSEGIIYFLVISSGTTGEVDSLYAVNSDGSRRWATGLRLGSPGDFISAPKIDNSGLIYIGDGTSAFCIVGKGGPAPSSWPMFQGDIRNSGRAR